MSVRSLPAIAAGLIALLCAAALPTGAAANGKIKIAFVGDSSADGLWGGITRIVSRDSCFSGALELARLAKNGTGLTRPDKFNWVAEVGRIAERDKPALYVVSLGLNDRQSVVLSGQVTMPESPDYPNRYRERVAEMIKAATASGAGVIWVGLAAMREAPANADAEAKNKLFAAAVQAAGAPGVQYVDRRKVEGAGGDTFSTYIPDKSGTLIQIRVPDGVHFTPGGDEIVAAELLPKIVANLRDRNIPGAAVCLK